MTDEITTSHRGSTPGVTYLNVSQGLPIQDETLAFAHGIVDVEILSRQECFVNIQRSEVPIKQTSRQAVNFARITPHKPHHRSKSLNRGLIPDHALNGLGKRRFCVRVFFRRGI